MAIKTIPFDPAEYLDDDEAMAGYLSDALETNEPAYIADALGVVARAKGMARIAEDTGLSRESLYRALSDRGNPEFSTVLRVVSALGMQLNATVADVPANAKVVDLSSRQAKRGGGGRAVKVAKRRATKTVTKAPVAKRVAAKKAPKTGADKGL